MHPTVKFKVYSLSSFTPQPAVLAYHGILSGRFSVDCDTQTVALYLVPLKGQTKFLGYAPNKRVYKPTLLELPVYKGQRLEKREEKTTVWFAPINIHGKGSRSPRFTLQTEKIVSKNYHKANRNYKVNLGADKIEFDSTVGIDMFRFSAELQPLFSKKYKNRPFRVYGAELTYCGKFRKGFTVTPPEQGAYISYLLIPNKRLFGKRYHPLLVNLDFRKVDGSYYLTGPYGQRKIVPPQSHVTLYPIAFSKKREPPHRGKKETTIIHRKPVIYAYSDTAINFSATLSLQSGEFSFVYPIFNSGQTWQMQTGQNGALFDGNDNEYPYLFWEGENAEIAFKRQEGKLIGEIVLRDSLIFFLENRLTQLGLNATERADFITFWGPRMVGYNQTFVQFLVDEDYDRMVAHLEISPKPDAFRRVYMLYAPVPKQFDTGEILLPNYPVFERNGFTVLEWGGSDMRAEGLREGL